MYFNLFNLFLYKYSSLLYLDIVNSGECDIKEREKVEWWGDLILNVNIIVIGDYLYKRVWCVVSCVLYMVSLIGLGRRGWFFFFKYWDRL